MFPIIFVEGLFGGAIYANTFYLASEEIEDRLREFCMSSISFWYSCGILLAGLIGIPCQDYLQKWRDRGPMPPHMPTPSPNLTSAPSHASPLPVASSVPSPTALNYA